MDQGSYPLAGKQRPESGAVHSWTAGGRRRPLPHAAITLRAPPRPALRSAGSRAGSRRRRETGPSCGTMDSPWPPAQPRWRGGGATQNRTGEWEICSLLPYQLGYGATETALLVVGLSALVNLPARAYFCAGFLARGTTNPRERRRSTLRSWRRL